MTSLTLARRPARTRATGGGTRRAAAATALVAAALTLSACSVTNPMTTMDAYASSDGVRVEVGDLILSNLLVLTSAEGAPGTVLGAVSNDGRQDVEVTIGLAEGEPTTFPVAAGETVLFGPTADDGQSLEVESVPAPPGALVEMIVVSDVGGMTSFRVPVLDGTFPEYAELVPEG